MKELQITPTITNREGASMHAYLSDIARVSLLTADEEVMLTKKIRLGDEAAMQRLIAANLRFVVSVAKKYQNLGLTLSDLIAEGNLGLIKAAHRFDETRGFKFISFAVWWIRQSILAAIGEQSRIIRLPMNQLGMITRANKAASQMEQVAERLPTHEELAEYLGTEPDRVTDALQYAARTKSFDAPMSSDEDACSLLEKLPADMPLPDYELNMEEQKMQVAHLLNVLPARERRILVLTFGLEGGRELPPVEIAEIIGYSPERVRQLRNQALGKLREAVAGNGAFCAN